MKNPKALSMLLVLAMLLSLFAACGNSSTTETTTTEAETTTVETAEAAEATEVAEEPAASESAEASAEPAESAPAAEEPETVEADRSIELPLTTDGASYSYFVSFPGIMSQFFESPFYDYPAWIELENRTGVHIEWQTVSLDAEMETFNLMISSGDYVDIFASAKLNDSMDFYVDENVVWDLKDMIQEYMPNYLYNISQYPEYEESIGSESDEGHWSVLHNYTTNTTYNGGLVIRQDWLDQLGLDLPTTIDEYHDVLTAFKNELGATSALWINSDGLLTNDYIASAYDISAWYNGNGQLTYPIYQVDGEVKYGPAEQGYYEYLSTLAQWYQEGLIYADFMTYTSSNTNPPQEIITNGECGVYTSQLANIHQYDDMVEGIEVVPAVAPTLNKGDTLHMDWSTSGVSADGICISTAVSEEDLPLLLQMWDYCCSEEGLMLVNYGVEGDTYEIVDGQPQLTEVVTNGILPAFSLSLNVYTLGDTAVGVVDKAREFSTYSDTQLLAIDRWSDNTDGAYNLPALMTLNTEESDAFNAKFNDIHTYVSTFTLACIIGNQPLNEETWAEYQANLDNMGIAQCIAQYQSAYDRYMEKQAA